MRFLLIAVALCLPANTVLADDRPNIIFIMADDLGYGDLGCYGQRQMATPQIDRLAAEGLRFTQAYSGGPVCAAARSVLMTGLHNGHTAARDNIPHYPSYLRAEDVTLAEVLKKVGYRTGGVGKWSLGDAGTEGRATSQGFDSWFGYLNQDHAHYYYPEYLDDDEGRFDLRGNTNARERYSHDLFTERALKFIRESAIEPAPFFLYTAFTLPHFSAKSEDSDGLAVPDLGPYADKDWSEKSKKYAAMIHRIDRDVGRITGLIDDLGLARETLIVFTSDNGGHGTIPEHLNTSGPLRGFKRNLTEGGIRVPFIARWTGTVPAGKVSDEVIAFQDFLPTFAKLAEAETPRNLDGISIVSALEGRKLQHAREFLYWDYGHCRRRYEQAVRLEDWKGIRLGKGAKIALHDLSADLGERTDVSADHPEVVQRIGEIMDEAVTPSERYPVGQVYRGGPIWKPSPVLP